MKKKAFLIGGLIWLVIAIASLTVLVVSLSGTSLSNYLPEWLRNDLSFNSLGASISEKMDTNTPLLKEEKIALGADVSEISISAQYQSIKLTLIDGSEMAVRHYDQKSASPFEATSSDGKLAINVPHRNLVNFSMMAPRLEIDLPRVFAGDMTLESSSGSVSLDERAEWGETTLTSNSGAIRFGDGITCGALKVKTSSGSIHLGDVDALAIDANSASGSQFFEVLHIVGNAVLKSTSGAINCDQITAADIILHSSSGAIRTGDIGATGNVDITTSSASQSVGMLKAASYDITCASGTLRYEGLAGAGTVECSSGSINCDALDVIGDVSISSSSGTQRLTLAPAQNFELKISVKSGSIRASDFSLSYSDRQGKNAFGTVGDGSGGTLNLNSASGSINLS